MTLSRKCPDCNNDIEYPCVGARNRAEKQNRLCKKCRYSKLEILQKRIFTYERKCPKCETPLIYKVYHTWWWANKRNQMCRSCSRRGKTMSTDFSDKLSEIMTGEDNPMFGKKHTKETKKLISRNNLGNKSKTGQSTSPQSRKKMREAKLRWIDKWGAGVGYNPVACTYMDSLKPEYNFQHAMNGGEFRVCGYSVDGYDKEKNVVFEYDEPRHYSKGKLKEKDVKRMVEIQNELGCKFLRYDEMNGLLKEM